MISPRAVSLHLLVAAGYFVPAWLGLRFAFVAQQVTVVWPPTGIALAVLLLGGNRLWPGIALGAFLANLSVNAPPLTAAGIAAGNTLEALSGAWLLRRAGFRPDLERLRDVLVLVVLGALGSTVVSATIGVVSLCTTGLQPWSRFGSLWSVWWMGDAMGSLLMAPLLLVWSGAGRQLRTRPTEGALLLVASAFVSLVVFADRPDVGTRGYPLHYLVFPLVAWAGLRLGQPGTTAVAFITASVAIVSTALGRGPFALPTVHESLIMLQLFMAVVAATGLLLGAAIAERDAAEARRALDYGALQLGEERLRLALEAGRMGVWDWDIASGKVSWTAGLEPIHGLAPGTFPGTFEGFRALVHPDERERVDAAIRAAVERGEDYELEFAIVWPDRSVHWIATTGTVLRERGAPVRMLGVAMDVTERRALQEELRQRAVELAAADRRKDEFLAMLAHELRNPLAPLSTSLELLARDVPGRERFLAMAERQVKHLVRLVDDLLDVSRITSGKVQLRREPILLADVATRAVELTRALVESRGHALTVALPAQPVRLEGDAVRLAQVLANLLGNAATYTPAGGTIALTATHADGEVAIRVRDNGVGLSSDLLPRVFDLFVQGDSSLARTGGGLGIGLTLARALVELHGGRIAAESAGVGKGSEFVIWLPATLGPAPAATEAPAAPAARERGGALRILVVEDNHDAAESLSAMLEASGHEVRVTLDGQAALRAAETFGPDVVLSDLGLPGMDGFELARQLRRAPGGSRIVLVALSGYGRDEDRRQSRAAGFDFHLVKPPDLEGLLALLGRIAGGRAEERTGTA